MPLASHLMFKYSDVLADPNLGKGERSPKNFREQLLRCGGDVPLNVLATINNRLVLDKLSKSDHLEVEREFLSESTRAKLARARQRRASDEPESVVFTRVGALLTLKVLFGLTRGSAFRTTALGAVALHANDYAESADTSSLAFGIVPVVTEFAPVWELQNPPDSGRLLRRFYFIYRKLLRADESMKALLQEELGRTADEIDFAGLPFDSYFALLFGIYAVTADSVQRRPFPTSILHLSDVAIKAGVRDIDLAKFISERAMTENEATSFIGSLDDPDVFRSHVTDSRWASDFRLFRNRPLLKLRDGRFLVLDLQFLFESASRGLYWSLFQRLSTKGQKRFTPLWGGLFETYVQRLISHYYPDARLNVHFDGGEVDAVLQLKDALLVFEIKSGFVPQDAKGARDQMVFSKAVEQKFVLNEAGKPKGVRQLVRVVDAIRAGRFPNITTSDRVFPILVGEDPVLQTFAMNTYLDRIFSEHVNGSSIRLNVLTVDELETILPYLRAGDLTAADLFAGRVVDGKFTPECVNSTFFSIAGIRRFRTRPETFLAEQADQLTAIIDDKYAALNHQSRS